MNNKIKLENEPERLLAKVFKACDEEYDVMLDVFADVLRFKRVKEENKIYADRSYDKILDFVKVAIDNEPNEYFNKFVPTSKGNNLGQVFTPVQIVDYMVDNTIGMTDEEYPTVLDPACGCGIFLIRAKAKYPQVITFGIDIDPRMTRTTMINMRMFFPMDTWYILCANTLIADVQLGSENWRFANMWDAPFWENVMSIVTPDGNKMTFKEWEENGYVFADKAQKTLEDF